MPEIFPESSPGNFTYNEECKKWVMTVFHSYQWDLNLYQSAVFVEMMDTIFFYANLGVDILGLMHRHSSGKNWVPPARTCRRRIPY